MSDFTFYLSYVFVVVYTTIMQSPCTSESWYSSNRSADYTMMLTYCNFCQVHAVTFQPDVRIAFLFDLRVRACLVYQRTKPVFLNRSC
jgi:hypothetical protein